MMTRIKVRIIINHHGEYYSASLITEEHKVLGHTGELRTSSMVARGDALKLAKQLGVMAICKSQRSL